jgi:hypothetical protein
MLPRHESPLVGEIKSAAGAAGECLLPIWVFVIAEGNRKHMGVGLRTICDGFECGRPPSACPNR